MSFRTNPKAKSVPIKENRRKTKNFPPIFCVAFSTWFLILPVLYGLVLVDRRALDGLFSIHTFFIQRGRPEFKTPVSLGILWATFLVSLTQLAMTILILV
jgi:hypothetical protein